jgi:hypothetical protein
MRLILAVEPDRAQADALAAMTADLRPAGLVITRTAHEALQLVSEVRPSLVLVSQLLSQKDERAIGDALRQMDVCVQSLMIPLLGPPLGCDPTLFSAQILDYLERARQERNEEQIEHAEEGHMPGMEDRRPAVEEGPEASIDANEPEWEEISFGYDEPPSPPPVAAAVDPKAWFDPERYDLEALIEKLDEVTR